LAGARRRSPRGKMKEKFTKQLLIGLVLALALTAIIAAPVLAGLRVTNAKIQESASPGQVITTVMNVSDNTDAPMDITVDVDGLGNYLDGPVLAVVPESDASPYTARTFTTASPASFHLEAGQTQSVTVTISVPANVGDGGRYAIVFIRTIPSGTGVAISTAVAAQVLLTIQGSNLIITGDITSLNLSTPKSEQLFSIAAIVNNTGNYHYKLSLNGSVKDNLGQVVGEAWQTDSIYNLIPTFAQQVNVPFNISQELAPGVYTAQVDAYTTDGVFLDSSTIEFALTSTYKPMPLETLAVEFWDTGKADNLKWAVAQDGTLMQAVSASSLNSTVTISIAQGSKVHDSNGQAANYISVTLVNPPPPAGYTMISAYNFQPGNITFDPKADITLEYTLAQLPKGVSAANLKIAYFDQTTLQWTVLNDSEVSINPVTHKITFSTTHTGIYAIVVPPLPKTATILGLAKTTWVYIGIGFLWIIVVILILLIMSRMKRKKDKKEPEKDKKKEQGKKPEPKS
jgi:P pilus assembly chaperone PapD